MVVLLCNPPFILFSSGPQGRDRTGRNEAYDHPTMAGLTEGACKTLLNGSRTAVDHDVTAISSVTAGTTCWL